MFRRQTVKVAGWYQRWARVVLGVVGLTAETGALCSDVAGRRACATDAISSLQASGLPIGYPGGCDVTSGLPRCFTWSDGTPWHWWDVPPKILDWAITARESGDPGLR